jgi:hypothetical protein
MCRIGHNRIQTYTAYNGSLTGIPSNKQSHMAYPFTPNLTEIPSNKQSHVAYPFTYLPYYHTHLTTAPADCVRALHALLVLQTCPLPLWPVHDLVKISIQIWPRPRLTMCVHYMPCWSSKPVLSPYGLFITLLKFPYRFDHGTGWLCECTKRPAGPPNLSSPLMACS